MEHSSTLKPFLASNDSTESRQKYLEEISTLPQENGWSPKTVLHSYQHFWFHTPSLQGAMYARDHFKAQPSDIFLCRPMKTGSTWLKALSFSIANRSQYDIDSDNPLRTGLPHDCIAMLDHGEYYSTTMEEGPKIHLFASHLPYTCLPQSVIDSGCKIVYLWRDPKDTFVSMWHYFRKFGLDLISMEEAFELFCKGLSSYGPYWEHVLGYWKASLERPEKILFLKYEDMMEDTELYVKKLADFLGCPFTLEEEKEGVIERIIKFCSFESLSNLEVNKNGKQIRMEWSVENSSYFRKGKVGDWTNYLSAEMVERIDNIMEENLGSSGLTFLKNHDK